MKNTSFVLIAVLAFCQSVVLAHAAKKEVVKDDTIIKLEKQIKILVVDNDDFDSALKLYADYARKNTGNSYYKDQYSILRRVMKMKAAIDTALADSELSPQQIAKVAAYSQAVRAYYFDMGYYSQSYKLDTQALSLDKSGQKQVNALESLLILGRNDEAQPLVGNADDEIKALPDFQIMASLHAARNGEPALIAKQIAAIEIDPQLFPHCQVYIAAVHKLAGDNDQAYARLALALENTPPTQMTTTRILIESMPEFAASQSEMGYLAALQTQSKVYQSGCTGGSSCNSCSLKSSCPSSN